MSPESIKQLIIDVRRAFLAIDPEAAACLVESGNVRRLLEIYEAVGRSDFAGVIERMTDDIEMTITGPPGHPFNGEPLAARKFWPHSAATSRWSMNRKSRSYRSWRKEGR